MRGYNCYEEIEVYRTTNRLCFEAGRDWRAGRRGLPEDGNKRSDLLQLEKEVQWVRNSRTQTPAPARRRELAAQTGRRRSDLGQQRTGFFNRNSIFID